MHKSNSGLLALALCAAAAFVSPAQASPSMTTGAVTSQPVGHYDFCKRHPSECSPMKAEASLHLTREFWSLLVSVNNAVNHEIDQRSDMEVWGYEDYWEYPYKGAGDCDDLVLEKRRRLVEAGAPASSLLITVVRDQHANGHAVLTVTTDRGDFILDNLQQEILLWNETPYVYLKR